jgi:hypothetical protein
MLYSQCIEINLIQLYPISNISSNFKKFRHALNEQGMNSESDMFIEMIMRSYNYLGNDNHLPQNTD